MWLGKYSGQGSITKIKSNRLIFNSNAEPNGWCHLLRKSKLSQGFDLATMAAATALTSNSASAAGPPSAPVARALLTRLSDSVKSALSQQRPWAEMFDRTTFAKPESLAEATSRVKKNVSYFKFNYGVVLVSVVVISMLWNPFSIFCLFALGALWVYIFMVRTDPVVIMGRTLSEREKFLTMVAFTILVTFGLTSVGSILMSGMVIGTVAICAHAAFRIPDDLFLDDQDAGGFLAFLGPSGSQLPASIGRV